VEINNDRNILLRKILGKPKIKKLSSRGAERLYSEFLRNYVRASDSIVSWLLFKLIPNFHESI
jgi:hypothetical protein